MAGFSSLALLGLGLAGGLAAGRLSKRRGAVPEQSVTAQQGQQQESIVPPPAPTPTSQATSVATGQARQAGQRQRRRAAPGATPTSGRNPGAAFQPASLLGF